MDLQGIRYFAEICRTGSFTKAARNCFVSEPTLSRKIRQMKRDWGVTLFHRTTQRFFFWKKRRRVRPAASALYLVGGWERGAGKRLDRTGGQPGADDWRGYAVWPDGKCNGYRRRPLLCGKDYALYGQYAGRSGLRGNRMTEGQSRFRVFLPAIARSAREIPGNNLF